MWNLSNTSFSLVWSNKIASFLHQLFLKLLLTRLIGKYFAQPTLPTTWWSLERTGGQIAHAVEAISKQQDVQILWDCGSCYACWDFVTWYTPTSAKICGWTRKNTMANIPSQVMPTPVPVLLKHCILKWWTLFTLFDPSLRLGNERTYTENSDLMRYVIMLACDVRLTNSYQPDLMHILNFIAPRWSMLGYWLSSIVLSFSSRCHAVAFVLGKSISSYRFLSDLMNNNYFAVFLPNISCRIIQSPWRPDLHIRLYPIDRLLKNLANVQA